MLITIVKKYSREAQLNRAELKADEWRLRLAVQQRGTTQQG